MTSKGSLVLLFRPNETQPQKGEEAWDRCPEARLLKSLISSLVAAQLFSSSQTSNVSIRFLKINMHEVWTPKLNSGSFEVDF